ncbi:MAG: S41 family peptidase [Thermoanaerobaculia bacterium]
MTDPDRSRRRFLAVSLVVLLPLVAGVLLNAARPTDDEPDADSLYKYLSVFSETLNLVRQNYVETTDLGTLLAGAMEGSTDALDPYSIFLPGSVSTEEEPDVIPGARHAGLVVLKDRGVAYAAAVEAGSEAEKAGLETGDILSIVADHPTRQMPVWAINHELVSATGKSVELEIVRNGETRKVSLPMAEQPFPPPTIADAGGYPMLSLPRIDDAAIAPARSLLGALPPATPEAPAKLIVDLRGVSGGSPDAAYALAGLFARGPLGELREKEKSLRTFASDAEPVYQGEIVVLVNGYTAGAAEIVAAALRQSAGAKLIGTPSFGWAGERSRLELSSGARLLVTTSFFNAADGKPLHEALAPDLLVDDLGRRFEEREEPLSQLILDRALRYLAGETELVEKKAA